MLRILVVEDNAVFRGYLRTVLEAEGFAVVDVGDGADALDELARSGADLILLDLIMPAARIDGLGLLGHLGARAELRKIPVAIMSGLGGVVDDALAPATAEKLRICSVIAKPFTADDLLGKVRAILGLPAG